VLRAFEFWICDGGWALHHGIPASHEGVRAVVHRDVPMSPAPRLSVPFPTMETDTTQ
jgi:hypothetical protein